MKKIIIPTILVLFLTSNLVMASYILPNINRGNSTLQKGPVGVSWQDRNSTGIKLFKTNGRSTESTKISPYGFYSSEKFKLEATLSSKSYDRTYQTSDDKLTYYKVNGGFVLKSRYSLALAYSNYNYDGQNNRETEDIKTIDLGGSIKTDNNYFIGGGIKRYSVDYSYNYIFSEPLKRNYSYNKYYIGIGKISSDKKFKLESNILYFTSYYDDDKDITIDAAITYTLGIIELDSSIFINKHDYEELDLGFNLALEFLIKDMFFVTPEIEYSKSYKESYGLTTGIRLKKIAIEGMIFEYGNSTGSSYGINFIYFL